MKTHHATIEIFFSGFVDKPVFNIQIINLYPGVTSEITVYLLFSFSEVQSLQALLKNNQITKTR